MEQYERKKGSEIKRERKRERQEERKTEGRKREMR